MGGFFGKGLLISETLSIVISNLDEPGRFSYLLRQRDPLIGRERNRCARGSSGIPQAAVLGCLPFL